MTSYQDDDLVHVDPDKRTVVAKVDWSKDGLPIPLKRGDADAEKDSPANATKERRPRRVRYYPWGSYKTMKKIYHLEGKAKDAAGVGTLDAVLEKAIVEPYWD